MNKIVRGSAVSTPSAVEKFDQEAASLPNPQTKSKPVGGAVPSPDGDFQNSTPTSCSGKNPNPPNLKMFEREDWTFRTGDQKFSKLKPQPGSEIFTKFANVKSRVGWTAECQQQLRVRWDRGDKVSAVAKAFGCKVGAINVARARFG